MSMGKAITMLLPSEPMGWIRERMVLERGAVMLERCKKRQGIWHWADPELAWPHHVSLPFPT